MYACHDLLPRTIYRLQPDTQARSRGTGSSGTKGPGMAIGAITPRQTGGSWGTGMIAGAAVGAVGGGVYTGWKASRDAGNGNAGVTILAMLLGGTVGALGGTIVGGAGGAVLNDHFGVIPHGALEGTLGVTGAVAGTYAGLRILAKVPHAGPTGALVAAVAGGAAGAYALSHVPKWLGRD